MLVVETVIKLGRAVAGWKRVRSVMKGNNQSDILEPLARLALLRSGELIGVTFSLSVFDVCWRGGVAIASILARRSASPVAWVRSNDSNLESSVVWSAC